MVYAFRDVALAQFNFAPCIADKTVYRTFETTVVSKTWKTFIKSLNQILIRQNILPDLGFE